MFTGVVASAWSLRIEQDRVFDWSRGPDLDDAPLFGLERLFGFGNSFLP